MQTLKQVREAKGLSRKDLAAQVGITVGMVGHLETGRRKVSPQTAKALEQVLGIPRAELCPEVFAD